MPELPEVETIRRELEPLLVGRRIVAVEIGRPGMVGWPSPAEFARDIRGRGITGLARRGKYLVIRLTGRKTNHGDAEKESVKYGELVIHLRLSGRLEFRPASAPGAPHERIRFRLDRGRVLSLFEPRALGRVWLVEPGRYPAVLKGMLEMGPEPVSADFTADFLGRRLAGRRTAVKNLLLDQKICCGVGNIYSDEALYRAGIRPGRPAGELNAAEVRRLAAGLRRVVKAGIRWCGTTLSDGRYLRPGNRTGEFQQRLKVYGRAGERCRRRGCRGTINRLRLGNRSSCFCPVCQE